MSALSCQSKKQKSLNLSARGSKAPPRVRRNRLGQESQIVFGDDGDKVDQPEQGRQEEVEYGAQYVAASNTNNDTENDVGKGNDSQNDANQMPQAEVTFCFLCHNCLLRFDNSIIPHRRLRRKPCDNISASILAIFALCFCQSRHSTYADIRNLYGRA